MIVLDNALWSERSATQDIVQYDVIIVWFPIGPNPVSVHVPDNSGILKFCWHQSLLFVSDDVTFTRKKWAAGIIPDV